MAATAVRASKTDHVADLVERHFASTAGQLRIGGQSVSDIAAQFGTPLFVYDAAAIRRQWQSLREALPRQFTIYYSVKANPNQAILRLFLELGCGLEIASSGELYQALVAGCPAKRIFFAGPGKTDDDLTAALTAGISEIHVESLAESRRIAHLAQQRSQPARIALRINPAAEVAGGGMRMGAKPVAFGIDEDQVDAVLDFVTADPWLDLVGAHFYVGTQILDHETLLQQYRAALDIAGRLIARTGKPLETIDFGGGLGVPYFPHEQRLDLARFGAGLTELMSDISDQPALASAQFVVEPGRFLIAEAGVYLARVTDVKTSRGKKFVITDGGMHHHLAASGNLGQTIKRNFPLAVVNRLDEPPLEPCDLAGPLCTPLDVLGRTVDLPEVTIGDLVGVFQSGAYARAASPLGFLSHRTPAEVLIENGQARLIRRRGADADYLRDQPDVSSDP
jgi:diaminopimelate decarboxylase